MFGKRPAKTPIIGIDIGTSYIKMAQFKEEKDKIKLINFGFFPTPPGCVVKGKIVKEDELAETISTLMTFHEFQGKRVAASISGQAVTVKQMVVEGIPNQELVDVLKWELDKYISYPVDQAVFDYQLLEINAVGEEPNIKKEYKCLVAVAPAEILKPLLAALKKAKLEPFYFEADSFSELRLANFSTMKSGELKNSTLIFINIGTSNTLVEIAEGENIILTRIIPMGIDFLKQEISEKMDASPEETENAILNLVNLEKEAVFCDELEKKTTEVVKIKLEELMLEIKRSISFFNSRFKENDESQTYLIFSGGGAAIKGIISYMEEGIGIKCFENQYILKICDYDSAQFKEGDIMEMAPLFSIAAGLALLDIEEKYTKKAGRGLSKRRKEDEKKQQEELVKTEDEEINESNIIS